MCSGLQIMLGPFYRFTGDTATCYRFTGDTALILLLTLATSANNSKKKKKRTTSYDTKCRFRLYTQNTHQAAANITLSWHKIKSN